MLKRFRGISRTGVDRRKKGFAQQGNMRCLTCYEAVLYYNFIIK